MKQSTKQWIRNARLIACTAALLGAGATAVAQQPAVAPDPADNERKAELEARLAQGMAAADAVRADGQRVTFWQARKGKKEKAAYLGVSATACDAAMRDQLKLPRGIGLVVNTVEETSPAGTAGVQVHDIITKIDDQWLVNAPQLGVVIRMHKADQEVTLSVIRQGQPQTIKAKLAEKEVYINDNDGSLLQGVADMGNGGFQVAWPPGAQGAILDAKGLMLADDDADVVIKENDRTLKIKMTNGEKHLAVTDADDKTVFDGPIETDDQRKAVPADISPLLEKYKEQIDQVKEGGPGNHRRVRIIQNGNGR